MDDLTTPPAELRPCYHPLSCVSCNSAGGPCGLHYAGTRSHLHCSGRDPRDRA